ncbi:MAG: hypothetical protein VSS75_020465, partial [Candidatus Parabeggiatoa sp.]|nr:hypothetical protein [Candidatus Parabeggiatoa sp.]
MFKKGFDLKPISRKGAKRRTAVRLLAHGRASLLNAMNAILLPKREIKNATLFEIIFLKIYTKGKTDNSYTNQSG